MGTEISPEALVVDRAESPVKERSLTGYKERS